MIQNYQTEVSGKCFYPLLAFKRSNMKDPVLPDIQFESDSDADTERERSIICKFCNYIVTYRDNIIEINGSHSHVCTNPAGNTYRIGCFSNADGCMIHGELTIEYTWFPGFLWNYAVCAQCNNHLGWFYQASKQAFYGLILNNLIENI